MNKIEAWRDWVLDIVNFGDNDDKDDMTTTI